MPEALNHIAPIAPMPEWAVLYLAYHSPDSD